MMQFSMDKLDLLIKFVENKLKKINIEDKYLNYEPEDERSVQETVVANLGVALQFAYALKENDQDKIDLLAITLL